MSSSTLLAGPSCTLIDPSSSYIISNELSSKVILFIKLFLDRIASLGAEMIRSIQIFISIILFVLLNVENRFLSVITRGTQHFLSSFH